MKNEYLLRKILLVGFMLTCFSCDKEEITSDNTKKNNVPPLSNEIIIAYGPETTVGNGLARSWVSLNRYKKPIDIGIEINREAFKNLPEKSDFEEPVNIPLPEIALKTTVFDHIGLNWNPDSFSTINGFKEAHFDIHFYLISKSKRLTIPEWSEKTEPEFSNYPSKNEMPYEYLPIKKGSGSFPTIGRYWLSHYQMDNKLGSYTIAMGTFNGSLVFIAPVITVNFIKSGEDGNGSIAQAINNSLNNSLPLEFSFYTNERGNYSISLRNFLKK